MVPIKLAEGKEVQVGSALSEKERSTLTTCLSKNIDIFAWTTEDMPGISREVAEHKLFFNQTLSQFSNEREKLDMRGRKW